MEAGGWSTLTIVGDFCGLGRSLGADVDALNDRELLASRIVSSPGSGQLLWLPVGDLEGCGGGGLPGAGSFSSLCPSE